MMILLGILKVMELRSISFKNSLSPKLVLRKFIALRFFVLLPCFYAMWTLCTSISIHENFKAFNFGVSSAYTCSRVIFFFLKQSYR